VREADRIVGMTASLDARRGEARAQGARLDREPEPVEGGGIVLADDAVFPAAARQASLAR
jgi:hypothetical protein